MQAAGGATLTQPGPCGPREPRLLGARAGAGLTLAVAVLGAAADQLTKQAAIATLRPGEPVPVLGTFFQLLLTRNPGAAFSLGTSVTWLFTLLATAVLAGVVAFVVPRVQVRTWAVVVGLFLAGIAGNLVDRLVRPPGALQGHVVDFLYLTHWPVFNVADSCICVAAAAMVVLSFWGRTGLDGRRLDEERKS